MAFDVNFWTFSKKERSTAQPSGTGTVYSCTANEPLDLLAPVISLALNTSSPPTVYNYARIANFSRYYWVTGWEIRDGLWWASLRVDALASWKSSIGSSSLYVYRSAYEFNGRITDTIYPQMVTPSRTVYNLPKLWTIGGANQAGTTADSYVILAGIIGANGTKFYAFTPAQWVTFYTALFSNQFYEDVLGVFGATEYPEAKVAVNPLQYIASAIMVPLGLATFPDTPQDYKITYHQVMYQIPVGNVMVPHTIGDQIGCELPEGASASWTYSVYFNGIEHPQAAARGAWTNYSPNTELEVFYPPLGNIPLDPAITANCREIKTSVKLDYRSGTGILDITAEHLTYNDNLFRGEFPIGTPVQLANVLTPGVNVANQTWYDMASGAFGGMGGFGSKLNQLKNIVPIAGSMWENGIQSAIHGNTPRVSTKGSFGCLANMGGQPHLVVTHWILADDDNAGKGRPLCAIRQISNIPGFITAEADELSISCTDPELNEIRGAVGSGFYYE